MLLVIMGAGASYDASPDFPPHLPIGNLLRSRLPLANQLFQPRGEYRAILAKFPAAAPAVRHLIHLGPTESIENRLEKMAEQARNRDPTRAQQLLAIQFYLSQMILQCEDMLHGEVKGITNHATLFDEIRRRTRLDEEVFVVTFNYDRLIEQALMQQGLRFNSINDYIHNERFKVVKLHGSVNWVRPLTVKPILNSRQSLVEQLIAMAPTIQLQEHYELVTGFAEYIADVPVVPALAVPVKQKDSFQCPKEHVQALTDFLPKVTRILIIGWKGAETPFNNLLFRHLPRNSTLKLNPEISIVGGNDVEVTKRSLENAKISSSSVTISASGFTTFTGSMHTDPLFDKFMAHRFSATK